MYTPPLIVSLLVVLLCCPCYFVAGANVEWWNSAQDDDWNNPYNWKPQRVPTQYDTVHIDTSVLSPSHSSQFSSTSSSASSLSVRVPVGRVSIAKLVLRLYQHLKLESSGAAWHGEIRDGDEHINHAPYERDMEEEWQRENSFNGFDTASTSNLSSSTSRAAEELASPAQVTISALSTFDIAIFHIIYESSASSSLSLASLHLNISHRMNVECTGCASSKQALELDESFISIGPRAVLDIHSVQSRAGFTSTAHPFQVTDVTSTAPQFNYNAVTSSAIFNQGRVTVAHSTYFKVYYSHVGGSHKQIPRTILGTINSIDRVNDYDSLERDLERTRVSAWFSRGANFISGKVLLSNPLAKIVLEGANDYFISVIDYYSFVRPPPLIAPRTTHQLVGVVCGGDSSLDTRCILTSSAFVFTTLTVTNGAQLLVSINDDGTHALVSSSGLTTLHYALIRSLVLKVSTRQSIGGYVENQQGLAIAGSTLQPSSMANLMTTSIFVDFLASNAKDNLLQFSHIRIEVEKEWNIQSASTDASIVFDNASQVKIASSARMNVGSISGMATHRGGKVTLISTTGASGSSVPVFYNDGQLHLYVLTDLQLNDVMLKLGDVHIHYLCAESSQNYQLCRQLSQQILKQSLITSTDVPLSRLSNGQLSPVNQNNLISLSNQNMFINQIRDASDFTSSSYLPVVAPSTPIVPVTPPLVPFNSGGTLTSGSSNLTLEFQLSGASVEWNDIVSRLAVSVPVTLFSNQPISGVTLNDIYAQVKCNDHQHYAVWKLNLAPPPAVSTTEYHFICIFIVSPSELVPPQLSLRIPAQSGRIQPVNPPVSQVLKIKYAQNYTLAQLKEQAKAKLANGIAMETEYVSANVLLVIFLMLSVLSLRLLWMSVSSLPDPRLLAVSQLFFAHLTLRYSLFTLPLDWPPMITMLTDVFDLGLHSHTVYELIPSLKQYISSRQFITLISLLCFIAIFFNFILSTFLAWMSTWTREKHRTQVKDTKLGAQLRSLASRLFIANYYYLLWFFPFHVRAFVSGSTPILLDYWRSPFTQITVNVWMIGGLAIIAYGASQHSQAHNTTNQTTKPTVDANIKSSSNTTQTNDQFDNYPDTSFLTEQFSKIHSIYHRKFCLWGEMTVLSSVILFLVPIWFQYVATIVIITMPLLIFQLTYVWPSKGPFIKLHLYVAESKLPFILNHITTVTNIGFVFFTLAAAGSHFIINVTVANFLSVVAISISSILMMIVTLVLLSYVLICTFSPQPAVDASQLHTDEEKCAHVTAQQVEKMKKKSQKNLQYIFIAVLALAAAIILMSTPASTFNSYTFTFADNAVPLTSLSPQGFVSKFALLIALVCGGLALWLIFAAIYHLPDVRVLTAVHLTMTIFSTLFSLFSLPLRWPTFIIQIMQLFDVGMHCQAVYAYWPWIARYITQSHFIVLVSLITMLAYLSSFLYVFILQWLINYSTVHQSPPLKNQSLGKKLSSLSSNLFLFVYLVFIWLFPIQLHLFSSVIDNSRVIADYWHSSFIQIMLMMWVIVGATITFSGWRQQNLLRQQSVDQSVRVWNKYADTIYPSHLLNLPDQVASTVTPIVPSQFQSPTILDTFTVINKGFYRLQSLYEDQCVGWCELIMMGNAFLVLFASFIDRPSLLISLSLLFACLVLSLTWPMIGPFESLKDEDSALPTIANSISTVTNILYIIIVLLVAINTLGVSSAQGLVEGAIVLFSVIIIVTLLMYVIITLFLFYFDTHVETFPSSPVSISLPSNNKKSPVVIQSFDKNIMIALITEVSVHVRTSPRNGDIRSTCVLELINRIKEFVNRSRDYERILIKARKCEAQQKFPASVTLLACLIPYLRLTVKHEDIQQSGVDLIAQFVQKDAVFNELLLLLDVAPLLLDIANEQSFDADFVAACLKLFLEICMQVKTYKDLVPSSIRVKMKQHAAAKEVYKLWQPSEQFKYQKFINKSGSRCDIM